MLTDNIFALCYFIPPKNFEAADPKALSKEVLIGFIGKGISFRPSINLASEKTSASLKEYILAIKENCREEKKCFLREIGTIETKAGKAFLLEISKSSFMDIRLLQSVLIKEGEAYVLTACSSKEEFMKYQKEFIDSIKSLTITQNLLDEIKNKDERIALEKSLEELKKNKNISSFQKEIFPRFDYLGAYWKILLLKQAYESIQ